MTDEAFPEIILDGLTQDLQLHRGHGINGAKWWRRTRLVGGFGGGTYDGVVVYALPGW